MVDLELDQKKILLPVCLECDMSIVGRHARKGEYNYLNDITDMLTSFMDFCIFGRYLKKSIHSCGDIV